MTVSELIAKLQQQDPAALVVLRRNAGREVTADRVSELTPVNLRAIAVERCAWFEFWDEAEVPTDDRTTVFAKPVHGLLLE